MNQHERSEKVKWFQNDRFGLFLHWGLYAVPARGEWVRSVEKMPEEAYLPFFDAFDPADFDPAAWARMAKNAGMRYAVLTAKHHDGFCLFDSALTDFKSTNTPFGRDIVREFLDAFRAEGLKVGLYYSLLDWHHPDYPAYGDRQHPMRENEAYRGRAQNFDRYLDYMHGQVRELLTGYGKIDIMWFDFSYDNMCGETWRATQLIQMARSLQPDLITDNRLEGGGGYQGSLLSAQPSFFSGDFACPEQIIPPQGIVDALGRPVAWEACVTMNENWGYCAHDLNYKPAPLLVRKLVECVSKGGNLLLNVGPDARGNFPEQSVQILEQIGRWMRKNSASIYGCGNAQLPKPEWGWLTKKGNTIYAHILERSIGPIAIPPLGGRIKSMRLVRDGSEIQRIEAFNTTNFPGTTFINFGPGHASYPLPDPIDSVVAIEVEP